MGKEVCLYDISNDLHKYKYLKDAVLYICNILQMYSTQKSQIDFIINCINILCMEK